MNKKGIIILSSLVVTASLIFGVGFYNKHINASSSKAGNYDYNLVWSDEFDGDSLNTNNWTCEEGTGSNGWGNNELQYYTNKPDNVSVSDGTLKITAKKENYNGSNYTSARLKTQGKQSFKYGKIEARIKLPQGSGLWPAFWMLGDDIETNEWPKCGEIDIMEHINTENKVYGTVHWDSNGHAEYGGNTITDVTSFHTYSIEWNESMITWFLDGNKYHEIDIKDRSNTDEFHHNFFILLNLAVGGQWPGFSIDDSTLPATMEVDYVRAYKGNGNTTPSDVNNNQDNGQSDNKNEANTQDSSDSSWSFDGISNWWNNIFGNNDNTNQLNSNETQESNSTPSDIMTMTKTSDTSAMATVKNSSWVDIHYNVNNSEPLNVRMDQKDTTAMYEIQNLKPGDVVKYWFTYSDTNNKTVDTQSFSYTHN